MDFSYQGKSRPTKLAIMATTSNAAITSNQDPWLVDSGTSNHLTANLNNLSGLSQFKGVEQVTIGNGQALPINNIGNSSIHTKYHKFILRNFLHVPRIAMNLLSVHKFCLHNNCSCHFDANELKIQDIPMGRLLYSGLSENGVYPIYLKLPSKLPSFTPITSTQFASHPISAQHAPHSAFNVNRSNKWLLWHHRLVHPRNNALHSAISVIEHTDVFKCTSFVPSHCKHYLSGKMHQLPFVRSNVQTKSPLEIIHCDVWGPTPIISVNDFKYYLVFVDDYTKFVWVYLLKLKSDVFHVFKFFKATIENQLNPKIKTIRLDGGGEFSSKAFAEFCSSQGIIH